MSGNIFTRILMTLIMTGLLYTCNTSTETGSETQALPEDQHKNIKPTGKEIGALEYTEYGISDQSEKVTADWVKFQDLSSQIELLKKGDLSFFQDDKTLLTTFFSDLKESLPAKINIPSIEVRLDVLETTSLKLESISALGNVTKQTYLDYIKEILVAHTHLIFQINKVLEKQNQNIVKPI